MQAELSELQLPCDYPFDTFQHGVAKGPAGSMEEPLKTFHTDIAEQSLTHAGQEQILEIQDVGDLLGYLPDQAASDHRGSGADCADRICRITGRFAVTDHDDVLAAGILQGSELARMTNPTAGRNKSRRTRKLGHERRAEDSVTDNEEIESSLLLRDLGCPHTGARLENPLFARCVPTGTLDSGVQVNVRHEAEPLGVAMQV